MMNFGCMLFVICNDQVILNIVERIHWKGKPNLAQIFVQLGPFMEIVAELESKTKLSAVIKRQEPVFASPAKPKDLLHTLSRNFQSELARLAPRSTKPHQPKHNLDKLLQTLIKVR